MRLVDKETNEELLVGQKITTSRGEVGTLKGLEVPWGPRSTGRVIVRLENDFTQRSFFPAVIGAKFVAS